MNWKIQVKAFLYMVIMMVIIGLFAKLLGLSSEQAHRILIFGLIYSSIVEIYEIKDKLK